VTGRTAPASTAVAVDLYWLPLGAGASVVRWNGRVYERCSAALARRRPLDLYHGALIVTTPEERYVIELAPVPDGDSAARGVVSGGPVGLAALGRFRHFRYELRCWPHGELPDAEHAVASPQRLTEEPRLVRTLLEQLQRVPIATWGRDEHRAGEMWNSNSVISWLLTTAGVPLPSLPPRGRAPGWDAGVTVARSHRGGTTMTTAEPAGARRPRTERVLLWLEVLLALGALGGAVGLVTGGVDLGPATANLPFGSTVFAGLALGVVNFLLPTVVVLAALRRAPWAAYGHHLVGAALVGWIVVQVAFLGWPPHWLQITYFLYGLVILSLATRVPLRVPGGERVAVP
jgi:hypothetical protein